MPLCESRRCKATLQNSIPKTYGKIIQNHSEFCCATQQPFFLTADHLADIYSKMFSDSMIAQKSRCGQTKTSTILNNIICPAIY